MIPSTRYELYQVIAYMHGFWNLCRRVGTRRRKRGSLPTSLISLVNLQPIYVRIHTTENIRSISLRSTRYVDFVIFCTRYLVGKRPHRRCFPSRPSSVVHFVDATHSSTSETRASFFCLSLCVCLSVRLVCPSVCLSVYIHTCFSLASPELFVRWSLHASIRRAPLFFFLFRDSWLQTLVQLVTLSCSAVLTNDTRLGATHGLRPCHGPPVDWSNGQSLEFLTAVFANARLARRNEQLPSLRRQPLTTVPYTSTFYRYIAIS